MKKYGLIGYPLSHTFSPGYFTKKFRSEGICAEYKAYELEDLSSINELFGSGILGLNVTIPYKEKVLPYLDTLEGFAAEIKSVNTISKVGNRLVGSNTDVYGFQHSLLKLDLPFRLEGSSALVLGTGGASKAINYVLEQLGVTIYAVSRTKTTDTDFDYNSLAKEDLSAFNIIVNTTPLGMYPNEEKVPDINLTQISSNHLVYDLIYNPQKTLLLNGAEANGAVIQNGLEMLKLQAEKSWEIWNATGSNKGD